MQAKKGRRTRKVEERTAAKNCILDNTSVTECPHEKHTVTNAMLATLQLLQQPEVPRDWTPPQRWQGKQKKTNNPSADSKDQMYTRRTKQPILEYRCKRYASAAAPTRRQLQYARTDSRNPSTLRTTVTETPRANRRIHQAQWQTEALGNARPSAISASRSVGTYPWPLRRVGAAAAADHEPRGAWQTGTACVPVAQAPHPQHRNRPRLTGGGQETAVGGRHTANRQRASRHGVGPPMNAFGRQRPHQVGALEKVSTPLSPKRTATRFDFDSCNRLIPKYICARRQFPRSR